MKKILFSRVAPKPIGPYSQAVAFGDLLFTSGQIALDMEGKIKGTDIKTQTRTVLQNLMHILEDNRSSLNHVLKTTVYLKDMNEFAEMNEVYADFFADSMPARTTVEVSRLPKDVKVEIDVIAYRSKKKLFGTR